MNAAVVTQFRMERRGQRVALAHQHRDHILTAALGCDHFHIFAGAFDLGSTNKNHFDRLAEKTAFANRAVDLTSVSIAAHGDVECAEARLLGIFDFGRQQDASRAGAKRGLHAHEIFELREPVFTEQLEECTRLASGNDQAVDGIELLRLFDEDDLRAQLFKPSAVGVEISLQG